MIFQISIVYVQPLTVVFREVAILLYFYIHSSTAKVK
jgi:hypothetical protein